MKVISSRPLFGHLLASLGLFGLSWFIFALPITANAQEIARIPNLPPGHFGQLVIPTEKGQKLALKTTKLNVSVKLEGRIARTQVEQVFYNPTLRQTEGTFTFRLPYGAAITRLAMEINGKLVEGELVERTRARAIYNSIVRKMKDPALLEWQGGNRFRTQVFPIPAKGYKRIIIGYDHVLESATDHVDYVYHLPIQKKSALAELFTFQLIALGHPKLKALPYDVQIISSKKNKLLKYVAKKFHPRGDLVIQISTKQHRGHLYAGRANKKRYGLLDLPIHLKKQKGRTFLNKLLLIDTSAGMKLKGLQKATEVTRFLLQTLPQKATFNIVSGDLFIKKFQKSFVGIEQISNALSFMQTLIPRGATNLEKLFAEAIKSSKERTELVYIGDGIASIGLMDPDLLVKNITKAIGKRSIRISAIAIGPHPDLEFLGKLARATGGRVLRLQIGEQPKKIVQKFNDLLQVPQLTDIKISIDGMKKIVRYHEGNIASGTSILIAGELTKPIARVHISGKIDKVTPFHYKAVFEPISERSNPIVPAFWANFQIKKLQKKGSKKKQIIQLSKNFGVMSRYTSFLVLENEKAYKRYKIKRRKGKNDKFSNSNVMMERNVKTAEKKSAKKLIRSWMHNRVMGRSGMRLRATGRSGRGRLAAAPPPPSHMRRLRLVRPSISDSVRRADESSSSRGMGSPSPDGEGDSFSGRGVGSPSPIGEGAPGEGAPSMGGAQAPRVQRPRLKAKRRRSRRRYRRYCYLIIKTRPSRAKIYITYHRRRHYRGLTMKKLRLPCRTRLTIVLKKTCYKKRKIRLYLTRRFTRLIIRLIKLRTRACRRHASLFRPSSFRRPCRRPYRLKSSWKQRWRRLHRRLIARLSLKEKLKMARNAVKKDPLNWKARKRLYRFLLLLKRRKEALKALRDWRRYAPENSLLIIYESRLLKKMGQLLESRRVLSEIVEFAPHNYDRRVLYARSLEHDNYIAKACYQYAQAVRLNPARRNTFKTMMSLYRSRYNDKEMRDIIRHCIVQGVSRLPVVRDISIVMFWEDPSADIDLHVHEPNGEHVFYRHRESQQGGTLYYDITNGLGPEIYVLGTGKKGTYKISVVYYSGRPRAIKGRIYILLHAGSTKEKRLSFPFTLFKSRGKKELFITKISL